jgi:PEP-CTERM motif
MNIHAKAGLKGTSACAAMLALCCAMTPAVATAIALTNGTLSVSNGQISAAGEYQTGNFSISYDVVQNSNLLTYTYTMFAPHKNLSHWLLQVSSNFVASDLKSESGPGGFPTTNPGTFTPDDGSSNAGMPANLFGYKFDTAAASTNGTLIFTIVTDRLPTNGNFFARDGNGVYAYDTGFANPSTGSFLIVPDSVATTVPEPSTLMLAAIGIGTAAFMLRRRR